MRAPKQRPWRDLTDNVNDILDLLSIAQPAKTFLVGLIAYLFGLVAGAILFLSIRLMRLRRSRAQGETRDRILSPRGTKVTLAVGLALLSSSVGRLMWRAARLPAKASAVARAETLGVTIRRPDGSIERLELSPNNVKSVVAFLEATAQPGSDTAGEQVGPYRKTGALSNP